MPKHLPTEATITINGQILTTGQAMTARVALNAYAAHLRTEGLGDDATGRDICAAYLARLDEMSRMLHTHEPENSPVLMLSEADLDRVGIRAEHHAETLAYLVKRVREGTLVNNPAVLLRAAQNKWFGLCAELKNR